MRRQRSGGYDRDERYIHQARRGRERYYSDSRASPDADENFMSDASDSMRSTQSERPNRSSRGFRDFTSRMESRQPSGRRHVLTHHTNGGGNSSQHSSSGAYFEHHDHGSMSDSGVSSSITERRSNRMSRLSGRDSGSTNQLSVTDGYGRQRAVRDDSGLSNRTRVGLHKQASKDSTDGSICSFSSDSSNAKQLLSNLSQQIESLNLRSPNTELSNQSPRNRSDQENQPSNTTSSQLKNNIRLFPDRRNSLNRIAAFNNEARRNSDISSSNGRRDSDLSLSSFSDRRDSFSRVGSSLSGYRRDSEASFYSTSERRDSFNSNISSCYEDE